MSIQTASLGIQVHGGMGYIEETGVAQHLRDARITTIYEGTTGIQALDLTGRKILRDRGAAVQEIIDDMRLSAAELACESSPHGDWTLLSRSVSHAADTVETATRWLLDAGKETAHTQAASAMNVLELFGLSLGAWALGDAALAAAGEPAAGGQSDHAGAKIRLAEFYAQQVFPEALARLSAATDGASSVLALAPSDLHSVA